MVKTINMEHFISKIKLILKSLEKSEMFLHILRFIFEISILQKKYNLRKQEIIFLNYIYDAIINMF